MDIYSSKKKARHAKRKEARSKKPLSPKQKKLLIILISVVSALTIILGTGIGFLLWMTSDYNYNDEVAQDDEINNIQPIDEEIVNIALFGIDTRNVKSFKGLSDSIMILSINKGTGDIKLISVMRDSLVEIPKESGTIYNKINGAYSRGGATLAIKTLNKNFGLDIKEYATVNFYGMADIIDAVGGIEIEVQDKEIDANNGLNHNIREQADYLNIKNPPLVKKGGLQKLSGIQAVAWARIRSVSISEGTANDYGRTDRQRVVIEKLLNRALDMKVSEYPNLIKNMLPYLETSLSYSEILTLSKVLSKEIEFTQTRVPQSDYVIPAPKISGVGSVVYYNLEFAQKIIHSFIYDDIKQEDYLKNNEIVRKGWYEGPTANASTTSSQVSGNGSTSSNSTASSKPAVDTNSNVSENQNTSSLDTSSSTSSEPTSSDISSSDAQSEDNDSDITVSDAASSEKASSEASGSDITGSAVSSSDKVSSSEASSKPVVSEIQKTSEVVTSDNLE